jgi:sugar/nucleoside kinase (ribokinase family)
MDGVVIVPAVTAQLLTIGEGLVELGLRDGEATVELGFGGDAANVAVMAAREGAAAGLVGRVGRDALGRRAAAFWGAAGVDVTTLVGDDGGPTGIYVNELGGDGAHRFDYHRARSAGSRLCRDDLPAGALAACRILHVTGITLAVSASSAATPISSSCSTPRRSSRPAPATRRGPPRGWRPRPARSCSPAAPTARPATPSPAPTAPDDWRTSTSHRRSRAVTAATLSCRGRGCAASYPSRAEVDAALAAEVA